MYNCNCTAWFGKMHSGSLANTQRGKRQSPYPPSSGDWPSWEKQPRTLHNIPKFSTWFMLRSRHLEKAHGKNQSLPAEQIAPLNYHEGLQRATYWKSCPYRELRHAFQAPISSVPFRFTVWGSLQNWETSGGLERTGLEEEEDGSWVCLRQNSGVVGVFA